LKPPRVVGKPECWERRAGKRYKGSRHPEQIRDDKPKNHALAVENKANYRGGQIFRRAVLAESSLPASRKKVSSLSDTAP